MGITILSLNPRAVKYRKRDLARFAASRCDGKLRRSSVGCEGLRGYNAGSQDPTGAISGGLAREALAGGTEAPPTPGAVLFLKDVRPCILKLTKSMRFSMAMAWNSSSLAQVLLYQSRLAGGKKSFHVFS